MVSGGAFLDNNVLRLLNNIGYPLFNGYGTTETAICCAKFGKPIAGRVCGSIGSPFETVDFKISEDGSLSVLGTSLCNEIIDFDKRYFTNGIIETNDIVEKRKNGYYITGRKSDIFVGENGENISPDIIQNELNVKNANQFCCLELNGKLTLILEFNIHTPKFIIHKEIISVHEQLKKINYGILVRDFFVTFNPICKTNAVKVSRAMLKMWVNDGTVLLMPFTDICAESNEQPKEEPEFDSELIALIELSFKKALGKNQNEIIGAEANFFFDLGGTSLDYFMLINELSSTFNIQINLEKHNNLYSVAGVYKYITEVLG
jgi:acyl carrier protein